MKKLSLKRVIPSLATAIYACYALFATSIPAFAASPNSWSKAGITSGGSIKDSTIYNSLNDIVYLVMAVGGFWVIICLLFAGMKLSAAQGNPQARTQGFIGLAMAAIGLFIIVKSYTIAGWIAGFGA